MKLTELNPKIEKHGEYEHLAFDCPKCQKHRIEIPLPPHPKAWGFQGNSFDNYTLNPSIAHKSHTDCDSHFFIQGGEIKMV